MNVAVLGGASCVMDDWSLLCGIQRPDIVVVVNAIGVTFPRFDHWASLHPECFWRDRGGPGWLTRRRDGGLPGIFTTWGPRNKPGKALCTVATEGKGSSGFFGVEVALKLGAERIVLCGIPMTATAHFDSAEPWEMATAHWKHWVSGSARAMFGNRVRSMSGRTAELLGSPDPAWLGLEAA